MKNLNLIYFALVFFLFSFTTEKKDTKIQPKVIKAEVLGDVLTNKTIVVKLEIVDNYIIAKFPKPLYGYYNYLYNTKGEKLLGFTQNGKEASEVREATSISPLPNSDSFTVYDYLSGKLLTYNIDSLVDGNAEPSNSIITNKLKGVRITSYSALNLSNERLLYLGRYGKQEERYDVLVMTDENDKVLSMYDNPGEKTVDGYLRFVLNSVSPNGKYLARVASDYNMMYNIVETFDFNDKISLTKRIEIPHKAVYTGDPKKYVDNPSIVTSVYATNDLIFLSHVVFSSNSNYRVPNNKNSSHSFIVLDRSGNIMKIYYTDRPCFSFVYNENDNCIYAVVRNEDGIPQMAKYDLNE